MWPNASPAIITAFYTKQHILAKAGILDNPIRTAYCFANLAHETGGWTIPHLTENINYTHSRVAQVWPNRYRSEEEVKLNFGSNPGWQKELFDVIYGNRMGNRPGTSDGSMYIGRGGPQITGREGYQAVGLIAGLDLERKPLLACLPEHQPAIAAAFWTWKNLNFPADTRNFDTVVVRWNGGRNGMADRLSWLGRIRPIAEALQDSNVTQGSPVVRPREPPATQVAQTPSNAPTGSPGAPRDSSAGNGIPKGLWATIATIWSATTYYLDLALPFILTGLAVGVFAYAVWRIAQNRK